VNRVAQPASPSGMRRFAPGIRAKVMLASSALLLVPWIGYAFVAEMVRFLNDGQTRMLADSARAVAAVVQERAKVLMAGAPGANDLAPVLAQAIELDGAIDADWLAQGANVRGYGRANLSTAPGAWTPESLSFSHAIGRYGDDYYAFFDVTDDRLVYCTGDSTASCDELRIVLRRSGGETERYAVTAPRAGPVKVVRIGAGGPGSPGAAAIEGAWRERERGYTIEIKLPAEGLRSVAFAVADVDDPQSGVVSAIIATEDRAVPAPRSSLTISEDVAAVLDAMARANLRIWIVDRAGTVIRKTGTIQSPVRSNTATSTVREAMAPLLGRPQPEPFIDPLAHASRIETFEVTSALTGTASSRVHDHGSATARINGAAHPIEIAGEIAGSALVEQTTESISRMREIALERLLLATLAAFVFGALILVVYVSRLSGRLRRLRDEAEQAIDSAGRMRSLITGSTAGDEIGDLSRSYSAVLQRLSQYTDYLENLARRLNHELRTPIAVVRSSLDNLRSEPLSQGATVYIDRAEGGLHRLSAILSRMSEATRLEDIMRRSEREMFDLDAVVKGCVEGYRFAYAPREILYAGPGDAVRVSGVADLIAQMLDKLVENAAEYATPGTPIEVALEESEAELVLRVRNVGPLLPAEMDGRLFESMVTVPAAPSGAPHLGLGLYIVRLIARFHRGSASAANRYDPPGVEMTVRLARYVSDPA
jgi:two-component system sensor histidine kinase ChvG